MLSGDSTTATLRKRIRPRMRPACGRRSGRGHAPLALYRPAIFWRVLRVKSTYLHCALWPHCSGAARAAPTRAPRVPPPFTARDRQWEIVYCTASHTPRLLWPRGWRAKGSRARGQRPAGPRPGGRAPSVGAGRAAGSSS